MFIGHFAVGFASKKLAPRTSLGLLLIFAASSTGAPPPDVRTLTVIAFAAWLFPLWGWWIDRHRVARSG